MALVRQSEALNAYRRRFQYVTKSAGQILRESAADFSQSKTYDIFLSHANEDAQLILGLKVILEDAGSTVYVDWDDSNLDHTTVNAATAATLRIRMATCRSFLFATTQNSPKSKWMPWELGYYDGLKKGFIGVIPLVSDLDPSFKGQEYLTLYPTVENIPTKRDLGTVKSTQQYIPLRESIQKTNSMRPL